MSELIALFEMRRVAQPFPVFWCIVFDSYVKGASSSRGVREGGVRGCVQLRLWLLVGAHEMCRDSRFLTTG